MLTGTPLHWLVALDCEMCITAAGFELTRIVVLGEDGGVLMDELVVPDNPITDHNTQYRWVRLLLRLFVTERLALDQGSTELLVLHAMPCLPCSGITAAMLEGVTTKLADVRRRFMELVSADTLVAAHSGENDLHAMKVGGGGAGGLSCVRVIL